MLLRAAYAAGIFPMADARTGKIGWYCPDPRGVLPLESFRIPRNLARLVRQRRFEIRIDTAFAAVLDACAGPRSRDDEGWMSPVLRQAYVELHREGEAHSVEAWRDGRLVGGLYGVRLHGAFFGESMFCRPDLGGSNASKVCLVHLVERLREGGFALLDTQMVTEHMQQFGCVEIPAEAYLDRLAHAMELDATWAP
ncbi:MAG: leucyl/phenylalanyl-tRNA--protein transferase [Phycisphaerales bacterium]|nr:leucyl/phenylalanyl-tRNA--protein transferase [Phycisphaerales bacterium]